MADVGEWQCLDEETLPPLERLLPDKVYQAFQEEIKRQRPVQTVATLNWSAWKPSMTAIWKISRRFSGW